MALFRLGGTLTILALALSVAACGNTSNSPKMQLPKAKDTAASTVSTKKPVENPSPTGNAAATNTKPADAPKTAAGVDPAKITKANFDMIKLEMTEEEVRAILGTPSGEKKLGENARELTWQAGPKNITATFRDGKLKVIDNLRLEE
jgi:hypothetical protein